jgi:hypothetical protein
MDDVDRVAIEAELARLNRRLSPEHRDALAAWVRAQPVTGDWPSPSAVYWRFLRQLCGQALTRRSRSDLDLAVKTVVRGGAWAGQPGRNQIWRYFSFVTWTAAQLGLDPIDFLHRSARALGPEAENAIDTVTPVLAQLDSPVDESFDPYLAVLVARAGEVEVDFERPWDVLARQRWIESRLARRQRMAQAEAHFADDPAGLASFRASLSWSLPWLPEGVPVHEETEPLAPALVQSLTDTSVDRASRADPRSEGAARLVRDESSALGRSGDQETARRALWVAAAYRPDLLGLVFRAAQISGWRRSSGRLVALARSLPAPEGAVVTAWAARPPKDQVNLAGHVETGVFEGFRYCVGHAPDPMPADAGVETGPAAG